MHRNLGWAENRRKRLTTVQKEQGPFPAEEREARGPQSPCLGHLQSSPLETRGPQALSSVEGLQESTQLHFPQGRRRHGAPAPCGLCDHCPGTAARVCPAPGLLVPTITVPLSEISRKRAIKRQVLFDSTGRFGIEMSHRKFPQTRVPGLSARKTQLPQG